MNAQSRTIASFLLIYLGSLLVLFVVIGFLYFRAEKESYIEQTKSAMHARGRELVFLLKEYHETRPPKIEIEKAGYEIALYDADGNPVAASFHDAIDFSRDFIQTNEAIYLIEPLSSYYLGVKYIALKKTIPSAVLYRIGQKILLVGFFAFAFMSAVAYFLSKIMIAPLKSANEKLDDFIKDTAHEMNTPLGAILMSIEHFDTSNLMPAQKKALERIEIGSKTLFGIYEDLTLLAFYHRLGTKKEPIDLKKLLQERLGYFGVFLEYKQLSLSTNLAEKTIVADYRRMERVIDNLLSNAIKYSKKGGKIELFLDNRMLRVKDYGIGIPEKKQQEIFERFKRSESAQGGFGIGLDIVSRVCAEYGIGIELYSKPGSGSEFRLIWPA